MYSTEIGLCLRMNLTRDIFGDKPKFAVLVDPDHESDPRFAELLSLISQGYADIILVGGSSSDKQNVDVVIQKIRKATEVPILLFPGNSFQLSKLADGLLLPSLISGRNPDYLIGKHVESASIIHKSGIPVFSMGYILVDGGSQSATAYITQTIPIPPTQDNIAAQTALAGQLLGMKCIYLESGSGAAHAARAEMIAKVKSTINIPLIVGGGIKEAKDIFSAIDAGADMVVVGTILEEFPEQIISLYKSFVAHCTI